MPFFQLARHIPLHGLEPNALEFFGAGRASVLAVGLTPFVSAFFAVELLSFAVPSWRRLRRGGTTGRRKLKIRAIALGIVLAFFQGAGIAIAVQRPGELGGLPLVKAPGILFFLSTSLTLVAGATLALLIAELISSRGIGNGFCVVLFLPLTWSVILDVYQLPSPSGRIFDSALEPFVWIALIGSLVRMLSRPPTLLVQNQQEEIPVSVPTFPQGTVPLMTTYAGLSLYNSINLLFRDDTGQSQLQSPTVLMGIAVAITILSLGTFHLFSSRKRLESNLPAGVLPPGSKIPAGWLLSGTTLLVATGAGLPAGQTFLGFRFAGVLAGGALLPLIAVISDIVAECRFRLKYGGNVACAFAMDNVYGSAYLRGCLANQGIDSLIRAFQYRSQGFFFSPIVKMEILVPTDGLERAQEIIQTSRLEII